MNVQAKLEKEAEQWAASIGYHLEAYAKSSYASDLKNARYAAAQTLQRIEAMASYRGIDA